MSAPKKISLSGLSRGELEALAEQLLAENAALRQAIAELRAEVTTLKGVQGRPKVRPSGMEKGTEPGPAEMGRGRGVGGRKAKRLTIHEDRVIAADVPAGSRFKGYEDFLVQDLVLRPHVIRLRRERWLTPDGQTVTAPIPAGIVGHFGPELRRFVLVQYHQGQVTVPRLATQLQAIGITISKRQVVRLLNEGQSAFFDEARDVLRAGLMTAGWISVDDTGARHQHRNGVCTQLGNDHFTAFASTSSKSRLNLLEVLRAGYGDYVINAEALAYMRQRALAGTVIASLAEHPERHFADEAAWLRHLDRLGITDLTVSPDPVRIASEGAVWGSIKAHGLLPDTVILSDDAGQFALDWHALCWVHAEATRAQARHLHRPPACRAASRACPDLVVLRRSQGLQARSLPATERPAPRPVRPHLPSPHRVRDPRPAARASARQQGGAAGRARPTGAAAAHERFGAGPAPAGDQAKDLRRHACRSRPRLPRRLPRPAADLRQAGRVILGLSRPPPWRARGRGTLPARPCQAPLSTRLTAQAFAHGPSCAEPVPAYEDRKGLVIIRPAHHGCSDAPPLGTGRQAMSASSADPPAMTIRRAVATDAAAVRDLTRRAYAKWIPLIGREPTPATENYDQIVRRDPVDLLLADGELVALVWVVPHPDHLLIENLAVAPAHQGQGLGRRMLAHAEALAAHQGLPEVRLYTNRKFASNVEFYLRHGYGIDREEAFWGGVKVHMSKRVGEDPPPAHGPPTQV